MVIQRIKEQSKRLNIRYVFKQEQLIYMLSICPEADVAPVKRGNIVWKMRHRGSIAKRHCIRESSLLCDHNAVIDERYEGMEPYCSECGKLLGDIMNYCGFCGAKMEE